MKKSFIALVLTLLLYSCETIQMTQIGRLNMVSNRNVNPNLQYKVLSTYSGVSQRELRRSRAKTIEDAVNQTVKNVSGGEFLMNVKIYILSTKYYAVEGDVWGVEIQGGSQQKSNIQKPAN
jgi:hypothetical protein